MPHTLLEYLTEPNPRVNNDHSLQGLPTRQDLISPIEVREWTDFNFPTLMSCYGNLLQARFENLFPGISPRLSDLECQIFDEDTLDHLLSRSVVPAVSVGLRKAWDFCNPHNLNNGIDITRGGRAKISAHHGSLASAGPEGSTTRSQREQQKIFPDWAGVKAVASSGGTAGPEYINRCPGDTKLSTKWRSTGDRQQEPYMWPIAQILNYCGGNWQTRYGYIITQRELVVLRFSREIIPSGLAAKRSPRAPVSSGLPAQLRGHPAHQRNISTTSTTSGMSIDRPSGHSCESSTSSAAGAMSVGNQSFQDDQMGVEYRPVEMKSIPWNNSGSNKLTVKLALWWIHMLAAAPGCDISIRHEYPPLDAWEPANGGYRHISTGKFSKDKPKTGHVLSGQPSQGPSTPPRRGQGVPIRSSSPLSSPASAMDRGSPSRVTHGSRSNSSSSGERSGGSNGGRDRRDKGKLPIR